MKRAQGLVVLLVLLAGTDAAADMVRILEDPAHSAQARVQLIREARSEINALCFLARNDRVTLTTLALLRDARRRGLRSRVLVDANFHHIPRAILAHLRDEGVEVKEYHPLTLRHPTWIYRRLHEKLIIADGARYITGGRNLAEGYFGMARRNYVDRDIFVEGPSAQDAEVHFERLWSSREVAELRAYASVADRRKAEARLDQVLADSLCAENFPAPGDGKGWRTGIREVAAVRFIHDPVGPEGERVGTRLVKLLDAARSSIVIESPYLVPSRALLEVLERKNAEGVYVLIVTNSFRSTDGLLPFAGYLKYRRRLVRAGIDIREFQGSDTLHAKSAVIDGRITVIGSYNVDQRSHHLDIEGTCIVEDEELARELLENIAVHVRNSWRVERSGVPPDELRMRATASLGLRIARLFLPLFEGQL